MGRGRRKSWRERQRREGERVIGGREAGVGGRTGEERVTERIRVINSYTEIRWPPSG